LFRSTIKSNEPNALSTKSPLLLVPIAFLYLKSIGYVVVRLLFFIIPFIKEVISQRLYKSECSGKFSLLFCEINLEYGFSFTFQRSILDYCINEAFNPADSFLELLESELKVVFCILAQHQQHNHNLSIYV
jgi:hypothetical protein